MGLLLAGAGELPYSGYLQLAVLASVWRLISSLENNSFTTLFTKGLVFGLGYFILALWWIYISLHDVGGISSWLSTFAVFALASLMALYFGLAIGLGFFISNPFWRALALPAAWVMAEYLRGQLFTGFPWMGLAESQVYGPFSAIAPYFGGLACTFLFVWAAWQITLFKVRNIVGVFAVIAFTQKGDKWLADLYTIAKQRLDNSGITQVYGGGECTYSDAEKYFSFRRDGVTGRMASLIWLSA